MANGIYTTSYTSPNITPRELDNVQVFINITNAGGGSITVAINGLVLGGLISSPTYYNILTSTALTAAGTTRLLIGPLAATVANVSKQDYLPPVIQVVVTANNANPLTYSIGIN